MKNFDVYHPWKLAFVSANGATLLDENAQPFLDFYGGHGVISIGHNLPRWTKALTNQLSQISYYSNAVTIHEQTTLAESLGRISGLNNHDLFLCNSGAEANENALKIASFYTKRSKILAFKGAFHGRTIGALAVTDNASIRSPYGEMLTQDFVDLSDAEGLKKLLLTHEYAAVIIEGIQGVAGVFEASEAVWNVLKTTCQETGTLLIADEIQSGCGRTGTYFAFQHWNITPDLVTMAKGIGNGFPVAGVLVHEKIPAVKGQLGTTFGGSYLACAAMKAVLDELEAGQWMEKAREAGELLKNKLLEIDGVEAIRGRGLMLGIRLKIKATIMQEQLLLAGIVTGSSACPFTLRLLPPLTIKQEEIEQFLTTFEAVLVANNLLQNA